MDNVGLVDPDFVQILGLVSEGCFPDSNSAHEVADVAFAKLEEKFRTLPEHEQRIFRYAFFSSIVEKAVRFQALIDVYEGNCVGTEQAVCDRSEEYMSDVLCG